MFCKKCGNQLPDDANFCPNCGEKINDEVTKEEVLETPSPKKATFKEGVKDLFERIFVFEGKSTRSQFNYGVLFIFILSMVISAVVIYPAVIESLTNVSSLEEMEKAINDLTLSTDILNPFNLYNIAISLVYAIFLVAPVFRRLSDCNVSRKWSYIWAIVFAVSQVACSSLLVCLLPNNLYLSFVGIIDVLGIANSCIFIYCMFVKSK